MRFLILPVTLFALAGCANLPTLTHTTMTQAKAAYGAVLSGALAYSRSCQRKLIPQSCWSTVEVFQRVDRSAQQAITAGNVLQLLSSTTELKQVKAEKGVQ